MKAIQGWHFFFHFYEWRLIFLSFLWKNADFFFHFFEKELKLDWMELFFFIVLHLGWRCVFLSPPDNDRELGWGAKGGNLTKSYIKKILKLWHSDNCYLRFSLIFFMIWVVSDIYGNVICYVIDLLLTPDI